MEIGGGAVSGFQTGIVRVKCWERAYAVLLFLHKAGRRLMAWLCGFSARFIRLLQVSLLGERVYSKKLGSP